MKKLFYTLFTLLFFTGCAYVDGLRNEKNVTPAPPNVVPPPESQSQAISEETSSATTNAARTITPATR